MYSNLDEIFDAFDNLKVLVIGDVMIDAYLWGSVSRISPEAPVPIVNLQKREQRLGGAANVALNIQSLGATPLLCSLVGNDSEGENFLRLLEINSLSREGILQSHQRITTVKNRIIAGSQHLLRVDSEIDTSISDEERELLWKRIQLLLPQCQVVIFEDYDKGVLDQKLIEDTITLANELNIPTVVDPKKRNFLHYKKCTLFKPNLKELKEGLKTDFNAVVFQDLELVVKQLKETLEVSGVLVTLSERGVYISHNHEHYLLPAHIRNIADVSGAGDTVVSVAALCQALGLPAKFLAALANLAGGLVCEYQGVVPIRKDELYREAQQNNILELQEREYK